MTNIEFGDIMALIIMSPFLAIPPMITVIGCVVAWKHFVQGKKVDDQIH